MNNQHLLPHTLYTAAQVRELDRRAIEERCIPGYTLMCRAGEAVFSLLCERWPTARSVGIVCGSGNNGGDGYVIAGLARKAGLQVFVLALSDPEQLKGDALTAYRDARDADVNVQEFDEQSLASADVLVDAVFGTGLDREIKADSHWHHAIAAMNKHSAPVIAVDIPSGLHADSGAILGIAVEADVSVSFIGLKQGMFSGEGPACCGEILFDDLAVPGDLYDDISAPACLYRGDDLPLLLPKRSRSAHKGNNGHVLIIGGDHGMAGAARLAAEAAARCGAGLISIATRPAAADMQAAQRPELMFRGVDSVADLDPLLERASVIAIGPGLGTSRWGQSLLAAVLDRDLPLVIDADALNLLAQQPQQRRRWILTPHPGEAARLLASDTRTIQQNRFAAVQALVQRYGGVSILKGAGSLIASQNVPVNVCPAGNPGMASGGMGDVLTGVIAGLLAQGLNDYDAARTGVYIHARAADLAAAAGGERGLLAGDLFPYLRQLVNP